MRLAQRSALLVVTIGLALVASALLTPPAEVAGNSIINSPESFFLIPVQTAVTVGSFNGSATLTISPMDSNNNTQSPIVNLTVYPKETVEFSTPARGFYQLELVNNAESNLSVPLSVDQSGIPLDLLASGLILLIIGSLLFAFLRRR